MSQSETNPFQAPVTAKVEATPEPIGQTGLDFIGLAKKWERYRLIYNGVLILETIALTVWLNPPVLEAAAVAFGGAIAVNFFFFLGPAIDGYCQWIFDSRSLTFGHIILFLGILFSALLAAETLSSLSFLLTQ